MLKEQVEPKNILKRKRVKIARLVLSLNDIEYGILRKPLHKMSLFNIYSSFYYSFVQDIAVQQATLAEEARLDKNILQLFESF
jgi:hypothetical protein